MAKRLPNESFADYKARCNASSNRAKHRRGWVRWATCEEGYKDPETGRVQPALPVNGTYSKKLHGEIPELRFRKEGKDKAND